MGRKNKKPQSRNRKIKRKNSKSSLHLTDNTIFSLFNENPENSYSTKSLMRKFKLTLPKERARINDILKHLEKQGKIIRSKSGGFELNQDIKIVEGTIELLSRKRALLATDDYEGEISLDPEEMRFTLDGDQVKAVLYENRKGEVEAEVVEVIKRQKKYIVGKISHKKGVYFLLPENRKTYFDIFVPHHFINGAKDNDKVKVEIVHYPEFGGKNPEGKVVEVFGQLGDNEAEMHSIMAEFDLPYDFPRKVRREAEHIPKEIPEKEIEKRRDFRETTTFTIDPVDAKDFDDALSVKEIGNDLYEIGVHIADVAHYVKPGTALETEAYRRATSVYLVDRVVPMLPEVLSNELCSLRPHEEKLTFSCVFQMNSKGHIKDVWIGRTIIKSDHRFTYEDAQEIIETKKGLFNTEIVLLNQIAEKLRKDRFAHGSISFETLEIKFNLDEDGTPINTFVKERKEAHKMIEDFMLLANKKVAEYVYNRTKGKQKDTMVYRVHEPPDPEKLEQFAAFAKRFGHNINLNKGIADQLNMLAEETEKLPEHEILQNIAIRSMSKAIYTTDSLGHFGLGFKHYTHFTSPIRRYPDVMVHRLLEHYLKGGKSLNPNEWEEKCKHSSDMEKRATQAERLSIKYKQVEYMQQFEGKTFEAIVSGLSEWGIFATIGDKHCEGMIRLADLNDDYYYADLEKYQIIGRKTKKKIVFGDKIKVRVKKTDLENKTIDLDMVSF